MVMTIIMMTASYHYQHSTTRDSTHQAIGINLAVEGLHRVNLRYAITQVCISPPKSKLKSVTKAL
jgi:hypothetical protein